IDTLCIDQSNIQERNRQVAQMGEIFSDATEVIVWLGRLLNCIALLRLTKMIGRKTLALLELYEKRRAIDDELYSDEYWSRAWITQQNFLAKNAVIVMNDWNVNIEECI
ncbi:hypothetical protein BU25DRAFT_316262, partial [Macroventuria anomochaeta]